MCTHSRFDLAFVFRSCMKSVELPLPLLLDDVCLSSQCCPANLISSDDHELIHWWYRLIHRIVTVRCVYEVIMKSSSCRNPFIFLLLSSHCKANIDLFNPKSKSKARHCEIRGFETPKISRENFAELLPVDELQISRLIQALTYCVRKHLLAKKYSKIDLTREFVHSKVPKLPPRNLRRPVPSTFRWTKLLQFEKKSLKADESSPCIEDQEICLETELWT